MRHVVTLTAILALPGIHKTVRASAGESPEPCEIVAPKAVAVLPEPVRSFFETDPEGVRASASAGLVGTISTDALASAEDRHYLMMDVAADGADAETRRVAARQFPHVRTAARELFKRRRVRAGGTLPWEIRDRYEGLVDAFRAQDNDTIVREAGALVHLAVDASLPFNTTTDRDGQATGHLTWPVDQAANAGTWHRTVRHRYHIGLIRRFRIRFDYEVRVWPARFTHISEPTEAAFEVMVQANDSLARLLAIDAELVRQLGITDATSFLASSEAFYALLVERAGPIIESRLEAAALLAANLVGSAWTEAGSPTLTRAVGTAAAPAKPASRPSNGTLDFVGSRNSLVFHRADCSHVTRIRRENRVDFATPESARAAGRAPCKTCQPDER